MKKLLKYKINTSWLSLLIFSAIYLFVTFVLHLSISFGGDNGRGGLRGGEFSVFIMIFVVFVSIYGEDLRFALQNGITRKAVFAATLLQMGFASLILTLVATVVNFIGYSLLRSPHFHFASAIEAFYQLEGPSAAHFLMNFVFILAALLAAAAFGLLLAAAFAKAGKYGRIAIAAGVPIVLFMVLPAALGYLLVKNEAVGSALFRFFMAVSGLQSHNPYIGALSLFIIGILFDIGAYLIHRKVEVK